ncbi:MAG TPA: ABC transporter permease subunit [Candidatus Thermoplasmatota archaeon]|nr:ABC transporter permease subunit [Candidatus Thermoplasmatota archaeon]
MVGVDTRRQGRQGGQGRPAARALALVLALVLALPFVVAQEAPVAFFAVDPDVASTGRAVKVDATETTGAIREYAWRWDEADPYAPGNVTEEHSYGGGGIHVIGLRVTDAAGAVAFANRSVLVKGASPNAYFTLLVTERDGGLQADVDATFSEASRGATRIVSYEWDWGEGGSFFLGNATESHFYEAPGIYTVALRVTDDEERTDVTTDKVQVKTTLVTGFKALWGERDAFLRGAKLTIYLAVVSTIIGFAVAVVLAVMRVSHARLLRWPAAVYIEVIRGVPLLVLVLICWLVLPQVGLKLPILWAGMVALIINTSAYQAEAIRGGIQGIPTGQMEAATSLGMTRLQAMRHIVLPQAFRLTLPPLGNELIILLKDTSLVSVIGVVELTQVGRIFSARTFLVLPTWLGVAFIYFVITYALALALKRLEKKLAIPGLGVGGPA